MREDTENLEKTRPVSCKCANGVRRNVENARLINRQMYVWRNVGKTRLRSYEQRYLERNAAWEEKLILYEHSNEWKKSRQEKTKEFHIRNALMDLSKKRLMKCSEDG